MNPKWQHSYQTRDELNPWQSGSNPRHYQLRHRTQLISSTVSVFLIPPTSLKSKSKITAMLLLRVGVEPMSTELESQLLTTELQGRALMSLLCLNLSLNLLPSVMFDSLAYPSLQRWFTVDLIVYHIRYKCDNINVAVVVCQYSTLVVWLGKNLIIKRQTLQTERKNIPLKIFQ